MKANLLTVLLLVTLNIFGQKRDNYFYVHENYEIYNGDTVNFHNQDIKTGKWIDYVVAVEAHDDFGKNIDYLCYRMPDLILSIGCFNENKKVGFWKYFSKNNQGITHLSRMEYYSEDGIKDSFELEYFPNEKIKSISNWENGVVTAVSVYYENGTEQLNVKFYNDKAKSFRICFPNGQIKYTGSNIIEDEIIDLQCYDELGKKKHCWDNSLISISSFLGLSQYFNPIGNE